MSERPTMVDVARLAGVSLKTVSRVVNHEAGVRPETESRVRGAVEALGYRANDIARNLRRGRPSATIGLVIEDVRNPFYSAVARAVEQVARDHGYVVVIANSDEDAAAERKAAASLLERRVGGLLIVPAGRDHAYLRNEVRLGTPVVFMDRPADSIDADEVLLDNAGGARQAAEHLLARGHRRIAVVADSPDIVTIAERLSGYRRTVEAAGLTVDETLIRTGLHDVRDAEAATVHLLALSDPPTAIFATNNRGCVGALRALHVRSEERSRAALVGFDDFELADLLQVTVVRHDPHEMGRRAADLLFARLSGDESPPQRIVLPTELVVRASKETSP
ncbi:MAG TPA: LacI family DNA-binding transcriptional regulator [Actinomycetota bacterium]|nr:LacI family DNA-binding transcriptional regulator [Actinomycetota bacterium]